LQRHPSLDDRFDPAIRIVEYDADWAARGAAEMTRIADALRDGAVRVDHIGSTAVPGLAAKPIIDLQLSVASIEAIEAYRESLERLGYLFVPDAEFPDRQFFARPAERPRTHHVHVVEAGSHDERRHLAVRDYLRARPDEVAEYEALKRRLVAEHPRDRLSYIGGKQSFIAGLEKRALAWAGSST